MEKFEISGEYIELKKLLKASGLIESGGTAKVIIEQKMVTVDGQVETRKGCKIKKGQIVEFEGESVEVC